MTSPLRLSLLKYTVLRLGLFVAALVLLALLHAGPLIAVGGAALISLLLSYVLLRGPREAVAMRLAERARRRLGPDADSVVEDEAIEAASRREGESHGE